MNEANIVHPPLLAVLSPPWRWVGEILQVRWVEFSPRGGVGSGLLLWLGSGLLLWLLLLLGLFLLGLRLRRWLRWLVLGLSLTRLVIRGSTVSAFPRRDW